MSETSPLDIDLISREIQSLALDFDLRHFESVDSTNRVARELAPWAWTTGTTIVAEYQEAGRGRKGRSWIAPSRTALLLSFVLEPPSGVSPTDILISASLAVSDAIATVCGIEARVKWPNDVLIGGKKVCGILAESDRQGDRQRVVIGIGLNVNATPAVDVFGEVTSVSAESGQAVDRDALAIGLFKCFDLWYGSLQEDPDAVFRAWKDRLETIGRPVHVIETDRQWEGTAVGVERTGGLQVRKADGEVQTVYAADVSIRTAPFTSS